MRGLLRTATGPEWTALFSIPSLVSFVGILSRDIWVIWGSVKGFIASGLAEGEELDRILERLTATSCQLWVAYSEKEIIAACVTELPTIANRKVCNVISCGGTRMDEWLGLSLPVIEAWAKHNGCTAMRFPEIRPGWQRVLKDYQLKKILLEKAL